MLSAIGFILALADFTGNTERLERLLNRSVAELERLRSDAIRQLHTKDVLVFCGLIGSLVGVLPGFLGAVLLTDRLIGHQQSATMPDAPFWFWFLLVFALSFIASALALGLAGLLVLNVPLFVAKLVYWFACVLSYPRRGIVGSIGLLLAGIEFLSYWIGRIFS